MTYLREISVESLIERAVRAARPRSVGRGSEPRWSAVAEAFGLGSTYSIELCKKFGLDPEERLASPKCVTCAEVEAAEEAEFGFPRR
jgi:hypothetical protein